MSSTQVLFHNSVNTFGFLIILFFIIEILFLIVVLVYRWRTNRVRRERSSSGSMTLWNLHLAGFAVKLTSVLLVCVWFFADLQQVDFQACSAMQNSVCDRVLLLHNFGVVMLILVFSLTAAVALELLIIKRVLRYKKKTSEG